MPRHSDDRNSYTLRVVTNKRPDGKLQYKVTLPKPLGEMAEAIDDTVIGDFSLSKVKCGDESLQLYMNLFLFRNPSESVQEQLLQTNWHELICPYCGQPATPPTFAKGAEPISHKLTHICGATYYVDRSDRRSKGTWDDIQKKSTGDWKIIHNYHIQIGKVGTDLDPDFDIDEYGSMLSHVIFLRTTSS